MVPCVVALCVVSALGAARVGIAATERARAEAIADLAALAAVRGERGAATAVAERNDAVLVTYSIDGVASVVEVRHRAATAVAAAAPSR